MKPRLLAEKAASETWANQVRLADGRSSIPPDKVVEVEALVKKLQGYYERVETTFARFENSEGKTSLMRKAWATGGYERLKDLVDAIKAINDALKAVAPPLPPYSRFLYDASGRAEVETTPGFHPRHRSTESTVALQSAGLVASTGVEGATDAAALPRVHAVRLSDVYHAATDGLSVLSEGDDTVAHLTARLRLWEVGLFDKPAPLDDICKPLDLEADQTDPLRQGILQALGHILVLEEKQLLREAEVRDRDRERVLDIRTNISALLGTDELIDIALEILASYVEANAEYDAVDEVTQDSTAEEHNARHGHNNNTMKLVDKMSRFVENLFDILPAVRAQQRYHSRLSETQLEALHTDNWNATVVVADQGPSTQTKYGRPMLQRRIDQVESRIAAHDYSNADGQRWQPTWQKMRERLEETMLTDDAKAHVHDLRAIKTRQLKQERTQKQWVEGLEEWLLSQTRSQMPTNETRKEEAAPAQAMERRQVELALGAFDKYDIDA